MVTNVADAAGTVEVGVERVVPETPILEWEGAPYVHRPSAHLTVVPSNGAQQRSPRLPGLKLPQPSLPKSAEICIRMTGIGGTGVVTVSQVLGVAAMLDGLHTSGLDQTGLSQKAGPVVSDVRFSTEPLADGVTVPSGAADVLLGLDLVTAASPANLRVADPERTVAVVPDSLVPTAAMVVSPDAPRSTARPRERRSMA